MKNKEFEMYKEFGKKFGVEKYLKEIKRLQKKIEFLDTIIINLVVGAKLTKKQEEYVKSLIEW